MNETKAEMILKIRDLKLFFDGDYGTTQILNGISFDVKKGETLGIVGESGCGKSMTAMCIMRLLKSPPARIEGSIEFCGKDLLLFSKKEMQNVRGNEISMIFQDPMTSLNPVFTVGNQLEEVFMLHQGMSRQEARKQTVEALRMVNIPMPEKRVKDYPHQMSGGMRQRVMIAMALACQPKLLIADEPTTALDVTIQAQVLDLMRNLRDELGTSILFITHDLGVVSEMCERAIVFYCGEIMEEGPVSELFSNPKHPYTEGLLSALPRIGQRKDKLYVIPGMVPPAGQFPTGCVFVERCKYAKERCHAEKPDMVRLDEKHTVKCFRYQD
ncbi:ABC transporter ATP-binding protein [Schnuerera ultunensis]|uniref:Oligopeptide ABC transporter (ATP-binding protein) n=2 Tax=Schnuerera ultunensis TaxID=45497 RepID=A0A1M4PJQ2_9FIRM|nr:ABC transporter ATP-binding protein [Schnuerera ultunensis]SHD75699.1 oligopeptide ABC transporter (ATP-binding protein) [[Clostridium] ultunense Esp]